MRTLSFTVVFVAASAFAGQGKLQVLTEEYNGREIAVKKGESFVVSLKSNPTTGYQLHMISRGDEPWKLIKQQYQSEANSGRKTGVGGVERFEFKATRPGTARLTFVDVRSFDMKGTLATATPWQVSIVVK
ncbi:MAG: protease inhibitor I42 family protein [Armatimonadota bacterium]